MDDTTPPEPRNPWAAPAPAPAPCSECGGSGVPSEARASLHAMMLRGIDTEPETGTETGTGTEPEPEPKPEPAARPSLMEALAKGRTP